MKIILMGAPGSGKGTQAELIKKKLNLDHISTGELIRKEISLNKEIKEMVKNGSLIKNEIILTILEKEIKDKNNILFDGVPRNLDQAIFLYKKNIKINYIIDIEINPNVLIKRLKYRLTHNNKNYNILQKTQKIKNKDNETGVKLKKRSDDKLLIIKKRLAEDEKNKAIILNWYKKINTKIIKINGNDTPQNIFDKIINDINYEKNI